MEGKARAEASSKAYDGMRTILVGSALALALGFLASCTEDSYLGDLVSNRPPDTWLASGPPDSSVTGIVVHFYWGAFDPDGTVDHFEILITDNGPGGVSPEDTTGPGKWSSLLVTDTSFVVRADQYETQLPEGHRFSRSHTIFVRAVDAQGLADPTPAYRSFTAKTLAPEVRILTPENPRPQDVHYLPNYVTFEWEATDEGGAEPADSVRYGLFRSGEDTPLSLDHLIDTLHTLMDAPAWSPWIYYDAPGDSGRKVRLEALSYPPTAYYAFAVQAKDVAWAVTPTLDLYRNVRRIATKPPSRPLLYISERFIGTVRFYGTGQKPAVLSLPAGFVLNFTWKADTSADGMSVRGYRYGWDIVDPEDPEEWPVALDPTLTRAPPIVWNFGQHLLMVEIRDSGGGITIGRIQVNIVPFLMDRPVLWVDDAKDSPYSSSEQMKPLAFNDEEHDAEWIKVLEKVRGFSAERDQYDVSKNAFLVPPMELIARYQNIVWNTGGAKSDTRSGTDALPRLIVFVPDCKGGQAVEVNSLAAYLSKGGHLWLSGNHALTVSAPSGIGFKFPAIMRQDFGRVCGSPDNPDTSGVNSFPYRHVGLVAIDKACGPRIQVREEVKVRDSTEDGLYEAEAINPDYPKKDLLALPNGVSIPIGIPIFTGRELFVGPNGGYRSPVTGKRFGFGNTDIIDPKYWLESAGGSEPERPGTFIPLWRHRAMPSSILMRNKETNGGWSTIHAWRRADLPGGRKGVMAKSLYMGFEPYFFEFEQFERLANYVFFVEWKLPYAF